MTTAIKQGLLPDMFWAKDIDGNILKTYRVGKYVITENLKTEHYNDGTTIPIVEDAEEWEKNTSGAMCYYDNDRKHKEECGALYNGYVDYEKLALTGWRIHTDEDWKELEIALGMSKEDAEKGECWRGYGIGDKMKKALGVVFAGCRGDGGRGFYNLGTGALWWSSSVGGSGAWYRALNSGYTSVYRGAVARSNGLSVRCVRELSEIEIRLLDNWTIQETVDLKKIETEQLIAELKKRGYKGEIFREERIKL